MELLKKAETTGKKWRIELVKDGSTYSIFDLKNGQKIGSFVNIKSRTKAEERFFEMVEEGRKIDGINYKL
jgi:hypothetical protein